MPLDESYPGIQLTTARKAGDSLTVTALPPGAWQTYDIKVKAPEFDAAGKQTKGIVITVAFNGVKVQDAVEVKKVTGGAWGEPAKTGPVRLQFHGDPVRFRNIWLVEKK